MALDFDLAVRTLYDHVKGAYDDEIERRREARSNASSKDKALTAEERDAIWERIWYRDVKGVIRFRIRPSVVAEGAAGRGKVKRGGKVAATVGGADKILFIEKPITGDPDIDNRPRVGTRKVLTEDGRLIREYDAEGKLVKKGWRT